MDKKNHKVCCTETERYKFHQHKSPTLINNIDINKVAVSNKISFGKQDVKYFIGYKDAEKIRLLDLFQK